MPSPVWARGLRAALIDLDGTLVDTRADFAAALQRMLDTLGEPYSRYTTSAEEASLLVGKGSEHLVHQLLLRAEQALGLASPQAERAAALQSYLSHYGQVNGLYSTVYPGVLQALNGLQAQGLRLACVTNKPTGHARALLDHHGLGAFFADVIGGDATERKKPHPDALLLACQRLGVTPTEALMVGDSSNDAQAARAAGCPVVLVGYGYNHGEDITLAAADRVLDDLTSLPVLLLSE